MRWPRSALLTNVGRVARRGARLLKRVGAALAVLVALLAVVVTVEGWTAFGRGATGERRERMERSPEWRDGVFENPQPLANDTWLMLTGAMHRSPHSAPSGALPVVEPPRARFEVGPASGLRVTWLGHSTLLLELDGRRFLTDPVWSARISPVSWAGPRRFYPPPLSLDDLPPLDAVLVSHDHYDHLDNPTIVALRDRVPRFIVPLGVGAHLEYWGVRPEKIVELDWWDRTEVGEVTVVVTPARHASGRSLFDQNETLWASYAVIGPRHRAWFSGDTGLFPDLRVIGERLGPFDVTMIEAGAYGAAWPDWHLGPEQAVRAHRMVGGRVLVPIHWGLFDLAYHGWTEPVERVLVAANAAGVTTRAPRPGESVEPGALPEQERWWPEGPWNDAASDPIVATQVPAE
jgi:L-ascorbate metabolism protein UlaG (beta-lactamase superfamily)